jgi:membrane protease YdiL (CAAX protease family)
MTKKKLYLLGMLTLIGFPLLSFIIHLLTSETSFYVLFYSVQNIYLELIIGSIVGWSIASIGWEIMLSNFMKEELVKYLNLFSYRSLNLPVIIFISLSAGIGEEIFFRGILQPFLGVIITGIFFVAIHGYINPKNWRISIYGLYMTIGIILIGFLSERVGLITAIVSHAIIDLVLLLKTRALKRL